MKKTLVVLGLLCLTGCAGLADRIPRAKFEVSAFGVSASVDTRGITDPLVGMVSGASAGAAGGSQAGK